MYVQNPVVHVSCQSSADYGKTKITHRAQKVRIFSVEVGQYYITEEEKVYIFRS